MSARAEFAPIRGGTFVGAIVLAAILVLTVFAWVNQTIDDRGTAVRPSPANVGWDDGKLEAMEGRQLAEVHRRELAAADLAPAVRASAEFDEWTMRELLEARALAEVHRQELAAADAAAAAPIGTGLPLSRQPGGHH